MNKSHSQERGNIILTLIHKIRTIQTTEALVLTITMPKLFHNNNSNSNNHNNHQRIKIKIQPLNTNMTRMISRAMMKNLLPKINSITRKVPQEIRIFLKVEKIIRLNSHYIITQITIMITSMLMSHSNI